MDWPSRLRDLTDVNPAGIADLSVPVWDATAGKFTMQPHGGETRRAQTHHARVYNNAAISIANNTNTALTFNSEHSDLPNDDQHSTTTNTSRLTCQQAGLYAMGGSIEWAANVTGRRLLGILLNGVSAYLAIDHRNAVTDAGQATWQTIATAFRLAVGDYIQLIVAQQSTVALNVNSVTNYSPEFWFAWLAA